jgi:O-antigen ligase
VSAEGTGRRHERRQHSPRPHIFVRVVGRLMVAQAVAGGLVGLAFGRRQLPSIFITLSLVIAICLVAMLAKTGTRTAWLVTFGFQSVYFLFGLSRFVSARYVGGTLFSLIILVVMLRPGVTRAYSVFTGRLAPGGGGEIGLAETAGEAFGERAPG